MIEAAQIRNFCIIAHVDHGKSTLADRFLELGGLKQRILYEQVLDSNPIERERGITIKLAPICLEYQLPGNHRQIFNLIDTPGHVDFSYEVSRALAACEGAILLVDATQGVQAQTLAHAQVATNLGLTLIPVINKIDLDYANVNQTVRQLVEFFGFRESEILNVSAKTGEGVEKLAQEVIARIPPPKAIEQKELRCLVFNSVYDAHQGAVAWIRVVDGSIARGDIVKLAMTDVQSKVEELGIFKLNRQPVPILTAGQVGYVVLGLKDARLVKIGDTLTGMAGDIEPLPGYQTPRPVVYLGLYPASGDDPQRLRDALEKLALSDSSLIFSPEYSSVLGQGFRCGFLGLLHADITQERLEREFKVETFATTPSVSFAVIFKDGHKEEIVSATKFPKPEVVEEVLEPIMKLTILCPAISLGAVMTLAQEKRGTLIDQTYVEIQVKLIYEIPLSEIIVDFSDRLKSVSSGYATMDYEFLEMRSVEVAKLEVIVAGEKIEPLAQLVVKERLEQTGRRVVDKVKEVIPRHAFEIAIQAVVGGKVLARSDVKAFRKDVIAKLSGGDQTRKTKLLERQKKGKQRMKQFGRITLPQEVFVDLLRS
ncbi:MAG: Elongation factor 4 [Microgenomates group bacterium GW2011_GWB1_44_8]|nr:MAG: Elongation factor 4 [Microgenomates group bacterium GW2011_GWB1_44_8]